MRLTDKEKDVKGIRHFKNSVIYSIEGLISSYKEERSLLLHLAASILVFVLGLFFHISLYEWIIVIIFLSGILSIELLNTSIEACVDLITREKHPLAKKAKDVASSAAFTYSILSGLGLLMVFMPYFIEFFGG